MLGRIFHVDFLLSTILLLLIISLKVLVGALYLWKPKTTNRLTETCDLLSAMLAPTNYDHGFINWCYIKRHIRNMGNN